MMKPLCCVCFRSIPEGLTICSDCRWEDTSAIPKRPECRNCDEPLSITEQYDYGTWCTECATSSTINKYTKIKGENQQCEE